MRADVIGHMGRGANHLVVLSSLTLPDLPQAMLVRAGALLLAREERLLCLLPLLRDPTISLTYVTSVPVPQRIIDYYLGLAPAIDISSARLTMISLDDPSPRTLGLKLRDRPDAIAQIRSVLGDPSAAYLLPFQSTEVEQQVADALGIPMFAASPALAALGTKTGSRRAFAASGVAHPAGIEGVRTRQDIVDAVKALRARGLRADELVLKRDDGGGGHYNARLHVAGGASDAEISQRVSELVPNDPMLSPAVFLEQFELRGGVLEEWLVADELHSPSVQLRAHFDGSVEIISTHDQILGGATGQRYEGCRFPADERYAEAITRQAIAVGRYLARRGVVGHFGIDFVALRRADGSWETYAIEINLRMSGTTVPFMTLQQATGGTYDPDSAAFVARDGSQRYYVSRDELRGDALTGMTPDDLLDLGTRSGVAWDRTRQTGVIFHCLSGARASGSVGVTAIAASREGADELYARVRDAFTSPAVSTEH